MALTYLSRVPNLATAVEVLAGEGLPTEARALCRASVEMAIKLGYILQRYVEGGTPVDRVPAEREQLALDVWDLERIEDIKMITAGASHSPGLFEAGFLRTAAVARTRFQERATKRTLAEMADEAGMIADYRTFFGPMSQDGHGCIASSRASTLHKGDAVETAFAITYCAKFTIILLSLTAQLVGDKVGLDQVEPLRLRLVMLPRQPG